MEADPGGEGGCMSTTRTAGTICWSSSSLRRPAGRVLFAVGTAIGRVGSGELSTGGAGLVGFQDMVLGSNGYFRVVYHR